MAVDILPAELPRDSSNHFSNVLMPFVKEIAAADYSTSFDGLALPDAVKRALVVHGGRLTPSYSHISDFLK